MKTIAALVACVILLLPANAVAGPSELLDRWVSMSDAQKHVAVREVASVMYVMTEDKHLEQVCLLLVQNFALRETLFKGVRAALVEYESQDVDMATLSAAILSVILVLDATSKMESESNR